MRLPSSLLLTTLLMLLVFLGIAAVPVLRQVEFATLAAERASAALGRDVQIESLRIEPGLVARVALRGAQLANIQGGSAPEMVRLGTLVVDVELLPLLNGTVVLRNAQVDGLHVLLERTADGRRNWRFHGDPAGPSTPFAPEPPDRSGLPLLQDVQLSGSEIVFRTRSGTRLTTRLDQVRLAAPAPDEPIRMEVQGAWNTEAVTLEGQLGSPEQLRDGRTPFPMALTARSGDVQLGFDGQSLDPLNFDRLDGRLRLAGTIGRLLTLMGDPSANRVPIELAGAFTHQGDLWRLTQATGQLDGARLTAALLALNEGRPDRVEAEAHVARIDLERLLGSGGGGSSGGESDVPMSTFHAPDPALRLRITAGEFLHDWLRARDAALDMTMEAGRTMVNRLALGLFGGRLGAAARIEAGATSGTMLVEASLDAADIDPIRQALGLDPLPLRGRVEVRAAMEGAGGTLRQAYRQAQIMAVLSMRQGSVARAVVEMASTNIRALFRRAQDFVPLTCLLGVVQMRNDQGTAAPLRLRASIGTVNAAVGFDLDRRLVDAVIASRRRTTGPLALDLPVRVRGSFDDPAIDLARLTTAERNWLTSTPPANLPPALRDFARRSPCQQP